jgi:hypothetical protein
MATWVITFHGGDASKSSAINTLVTVQLGGPLPAMRELRGFTVGPDGDLFVVNAYDQSSAILKFDKASTLPVSFKSTFTTSKLDHPFDLLFGPDGDLYVSNQDSNAITVYEGTSGKNPGNYKSTFVSSGLNAVRGLACDGTYWYVADEQGHSAVELYRCRGCHPLTLRRPTISLHRKRLR